MTRLGKAAAGAACGLLLQGAAWAGDSFRSVARTLGRTAARAGIARVAVMPPASVDGSDPAEGRIVAERLVTAFAADGRVKVVERAALASVMDEHRLGVTGAVDRRGLARLGGLLQAEAVVTGTFATLGPTVEVHLRLVRLETGEVLAARDATLKREWLSGTLLGMPVHSPLSTQDAVADVLAFQREEGLAPREPAPSLEAASAVEDPSALRDALAPDSCRDAGRRIDALEASVLDLKARHWAVQVRRRGSSARGLPVQPGEVISDPALRGRFYELLKAAVERDAPSLGVSEIKRFIAADGEAYRLHALCRAVR